ncbi:rhomboid family intramembrane serine protease [candidate division WOR-3 bacterium]|nr:rhomboid family intramembrane serine protease [candidate division WOR-3 bacterium]
MLPLKDNIPVKTFPIFTIFIIALNVFLFGYELHLGKGLGIFIRRFGCTPYEITHAIDLYPHIDFPVYLTLITSIFLHGSWWHILGNMWFLFIFGDNIEDWLGHKRFILFYLGCGIAASLIQILFHWTSKIPTVGASGAIAGIMGAYLILYPRAKVLCLIPIFFFFRIIALPAFLFLGFWIVWQLFSSMVTFAGGSSIAFFAHIGGFFVGLFWVRWFKKRKFRGWV